MLHFSFTRSLYVCIFCALIFFIPSQGIAQENSILEFLPAIISSHSGTITPQPPGSDHKSITKWQGTETCLACHIEEAREVFSSVHYQWLGKTPYMNNGPEMQGKLNVGVNSYCINITGNWNGCGNCHVGLGALPQTNMTRSQLQNIDCLICHQQNYKRKKANGVFVPDLEKMTISMVTAAKTVHKPTRATCLPCHAKGGGGDNYKRGDMALAHISTSDKTFDVHMATTGANLNCQSCHTTRLHRMAGRGSDLRPTDLDKKMLCSKCHEEDGSSEIHDSKTLNNHISRVSCQSCHIASYARNASDTEASEETEIHRSWLEPHLTSSGAIHPTPTMAGNLNPKYLWWNGQSTSYLLFDKVVTDPITGKIPTSRPVGSVNGANSKLYPFKYKTALQPLATATNDLIALDTSEYFSKGDPDAATISGLENMGYSSTAEYQWVETDTYQLITHEVMQASKALSCNKCHDSTSRMDLQGKLGYQLKGPKATICVQCHEEEEEEHSGYVWIHDKHVKDKKYDCSWCHQFTRPERRLGG